VTIQRAIDDVAPDGGRSVVYRPREPESALFGRRAEPARAEVIDLTVPLERPAQRQAS